MIKSRLILACIALPVWVVPSVVLAEDQSNLQAVEINDDDDFSLEGPDNEAPIEAVTNAPKDPLDNFSATPGVEKLDLGDERPMVAEPNAVNENVGLNLENPGKTKQDDTPRVVHSESKTPGPQKQYGTTTSTTTSLPEPAPVPMGPTAPSAPDVAVDASIPSTAPEVVPEQEAPATIAEVIPENDFAGTPYMPNGRRVMALGEAPEYYKVEDGDTLFDICDQLIDEPGYWPKLWALNPGIKNPHFIYPGMVLSFYPGDDATPPYLQVVSEDDVLPIETGGLSEADLVAQPVESIAATDSAEAVNLLTGRFLEGPIGDAGLSNDFEYIGEVYQPNMTKFDIPAFIFADEVKELGVVLAGPKGEVQISENDEVVIEVDDSSLSIGSLYTVVRPSGKVKNVNGDTIGYRYEYIAQIRVLEKTGDDDAMLAKTVKSRLGVHPEDIVIDFKSTTRSFSRDVANYDTGNAEATVIGFEYPAQTFGGQGHLVYLDKAFSPGVALPVYQSMEGRFPLLLKTKVPSVTSRVGVIKIIDTVGSASIGVVITNQIDIRFGDRMGRG